MSNRLSKETSPYLLQHKNNPVDWYPWGEEALQKARDEKKPILLSIGYSACHWCHVMEHESFEKPETAKLMNELFVSIKVDREERPDLDHIYQNVAQAMTRGGGWPLTVFLTPDLKPFYGGTYFPPDDRYGRPGFPRVLMSLSHAFNHDSESVLENAEKMTDYILSSESLPMLESALPDFEELKKLTQQILSRIDLDKGGMEGAPKFPNPMLFTFLWRFGVTLGSTQAVQGLQAVQSVKTTLTQMASQGIYDQLGGGFHRYSVDENWSVPHFEKMLYDNALLLKLYSEVLLTSKSSISPLSKEERRQYGQVLVDTVQYIFREMTSPEGVFYSAQDADSEGEEGKFFVWDRSDFAEILTPVEAKVMAARFGLNQGGNFEGGKTVLFRDQSVASISTDMGFSESEVESHLGSARKKLFEARKKRVSPGLDNKILTSWNGLMISGLVWAAQALESEKEFLGLDSEFVSQVRSSTVRAFEFLLKNVSYSSNRLMSTFQDGKAKLNGYLDDYAFMAMAALDLSKFESSSDSCEKYQKLSALWIDTILEFFSDANGPGYFFTSKDHEKLIQRPKTVFDQAIPAGTAVAIECLLALAEFDLEGRATESKTDYRKEAERQLGALFPIVQRSPLGFGEMLSASLMNRVGPITVSGSGVDTLCRNPFVFQKVSRTNGRETEVLVCHERTCSLPLSLEKAIQAIDQIRDGLTEHR